MALTDDESDVGDGSLRIHEDTHARLKKNSRPSERLQDVVRRVMPEDPEVIENPVENDAIIRASPDIVETVNETAGRRVTADDVISQWLDEYVPEDEEQPIDNPYQDT